MPRVPYNPIPSVEPIVAGEQVRLTVPPEAFGVNIGRALEHLGTTAGQVGNELFDRAEGFQQLNNENEARELQVKHAQQTAVEVESFDATEGKSARDNLSTHLQKLQAIRDNLASTASNPAVRRSFLNDTAGFMQRETIIAARHAGVEDRKYTAGNLNAAKALNVEGARRYPEDEEAFREALKKNKAIDDEAAAIHGYPKDSSMYKLQEKDTVSKLWTHRILGINDTNPDAAARMLEDHRIDLTDGDYAQVESRVKSQSHSVSATNIANETIEWGKGEEGIIPPKSVPEMIEHAKELANERHPTDPMVAQHAVTTLRGLANLENYEKRMQDHKDQTAVEQVLMDPNIKTTQQVRAIAGMDDILARLGPRYENTLQTRINNIRGSEQRASREQAFNRLQGLYDNDREEFLNTDLSKEGLSFQDFKYWTLKRAKALEEPQGDLRVHRAHSLMQGSHARELEDLGIYSRTQANKDDFDKYSGAMSAALDTWQEDHGGKRATDKEIREIIGPQVIQTHAAPGMFDFLGFGYTKKGPFGYDTPFYQQDFSTKEAKDWMEKKREELLSIGGAAPSDKQLEQAYIRYQYIKNYSKPSKGDKGGPPKPPRELVNE